MGSKFVDALSKGTFFQILSSPSWSSDVAAGQAFRGFGDIINVSCGTDADTPCLSPAITTTRDGKKVFISTLQATSPAANTPSESSIPDMGIRIGQTINLTIAASTLDPIYRNVLNLMVFNDPGLPIGMQALAQYNCIDDSTVCINLIWTPHVGQDDYVHEVHLVAKQGSSSTIPESMKPCKAVSGPKLIIRLPVTKASSVWVQPAASLFLDSKSPGNAVVGTRFSTTLQCQSNYNPLVQMDSDLAGGLTKSSVSYLGSGQRVATYNFSYTPMV
jgi:hypothetical protein